MHKQPIALIAGGAAVLAGQLLACGVTTKPLESVEEPRPEHQPVRVEWDLPTAYQRERPVDRTDPYAKRVGRRESTACQQNRTRNKAKTRAAKQARKRNRR